MENTTVVEVAAGASPYEVHIGAGLLARAGELAAGVISPRPAVLITDEQVAPLYAETVEKSLADAGFPASRMVVPAGEESKSMRFAERCCDQLIERGFDRHGVVFALGGGVVGDLAGFVAAIYFRGIPIIHLPTTVVAQVDSSIGGKTGVNASGGKNLIGAFQQPLRVIADTDTLRTLPGRTFREGCAEIVKHAVIRDAGMLDLLPPDPAGDLRKLIARNVAIKAAIVSSDEREKSGERALLNFGHTLGHAIENAAGYGRYLHGEAVSVGMAAACHLSVRKAGFPRAAFDRVMEVLRGLDLPVSLPAEPSDDALVAAMKTDKKFERGAIRFVLARRLGDAFLSDQVSEADIRAAIAWLRRGAE